MIRSHNKEGQLGCSDISNNNHDDTESILNALKVEQLRHLARNLNLPKAGSINKPGLVRAILSTNTDIRALLDAMMLDHLCRVADILSIEISREKKTDAITAILQALRDRREGRLDHQTRLGQYFFGDSSSILQKKLGKDIEGKVNLILTSPPFPLNKKKKYGNLRGDEYREWLVSLAPLFARLLAPNGSIVIELGNAWEPGRPVQSLLHLHSLIEFVENPEADLRLCQQFVCYNPARLPGPTQWVTVERSRLTDSFTQVWWMAKSDRPKADNRRVLRPYSDSMTSLLKRGQYNSGSRPSGHDISAKGFLKNHGGSIMPNVLELTPSDDEQELLRVPENILRFSNTHSNDEYHRRCQIEGITPHPARMPASLAAFFVEFLTEPGDLVLDPFGGSNTTGYVAELLHRRWIAVEADQQYARQSQLRFPEDTLVIHGE